MVISDKYKYIFIETPHTGSSAISIELVKKYSGRKILNKHANYHEFLKIANKEQKEYFVFAGIRNPLDEAVSLYNKLLTDHNEAYTDPNRQLSRGGWVTKRKAEIHKLVKSGRGFGEYLRKYYPRTYTSNINVNKKDCDFIIKFESINEDFESVLKKLGIKQIRPLPVVNKTKKKGNFNQYYTENEKEYATRIFAPFMEEWDYQFSEDWSAIQIKKVDNYRYYINKIGRSIYSRYVKSGPLKNVTFLRNILE
jgi:hypothetical protein